MCDRIAIIQGGRIRASGTVEELMATAASLGQHDLESYFLQLTGERAARELVEVLDA